MKFQVTHLKDLGLVRERQEDHCASYAGDHGAFLIVSDGMGGHAGGNLASEAAVAQASQILNRWMTIGEIPTTLPSGDLMGSSGAPAKVQEWIQADSLDSPIEEVEIPKRSQICQLMEATFAHAQAAVTEISLRDPLGAGNAGCTLTVAIIRDGWIHVGHIGDSRAYLLRNGQIVQLTADHSGAMLLVAAGLIAPEEARYHPESHRLYRFLGINAQELAIDLTHEPAAEGDIIMLCSDGLWGLVEDTQMAALLSSRPGLQQAATSLIHAANAHGGDDNISVSLAQIYIG